MNPSQRGIVAAYFIIGIVLLSFGSAYLTDTSWGWLDVALGLFNFTIAVVNYRLFKARNKMQWTGNKMPWSLSAGLSPSPPNTSGISFTSGASYTRCSEPRAPLPVRQQEDPFIGYKTLRVVVEEGRYRFQGAMGVSYDLDSTAECIPGQLGASLARINAELHYLSGGIGPYIHKSPVEDCHCGFYALAEKPSDWEYGAFRATVELFGRVIVGERGRRAERQRVLKIEARRECAVCGAPAIGFVIPPLSTYDRLFPVCMAHRGFSYLTPAGLTGRIGTEVRWAT